jgi:hypothetical protein
MAFWIHVSEWTRRFPVLPAEAAQRSVRLQERLQVDNKAETIGSAERMGEKHVITTVAGTAVTWRQWRA